MDTVEANPDWWRRDRVDLEPPKYGSVPVTQGHAAKDKQRTATPWIPNEIIQLIVESGSFEGKDFKKLRLVNKSFKGFAEPLLFENICFSVTSENIAAFHSLVNSSYSRFVKTLHIDGTAYQNHTPRDYASLAATTFKPFLDPKGMGPLTKENLLNLLTRSTMRATSTLEARPFFVPHSTAGALFTLDYMSPLVTYNTTPSDLRHRLISDLDEIEYSGFGYTETSHRLLQGSGKKLFIDGYRLWQQQHLFRQNLERGDGIFRLFCGSLPKLKKLERIQLTSDWSKRVTATSLFAGLSSRAHNTVREDIVCRGEFQDLVKQNKQMEVRTGAGITGRSLALPLQLSPPPTDRRAIRPTIRSLFRALRASDIQLQHLELPGATSNPSVEGRECLLDIELRCLEMKSGGETFASAEDFQQIFSQLRFLKLGICYPSLAVREYFDISSLPAALKSMTDLLSLSLYFRQEVTSLLVHDETPPYLDQLLALPRLAVYEEDEYRILSLPLDNNPWPKLTDLSLSGMASKDTTLISLLRTVSPTLRRLELSRMLIGIAGKANGERFSRDMRKCVPELEQLASSETERSYCRFLSSTGQLRWWETIDDYSVMMRAGDLSWNGAEVDGRSGWR